MAFDNSGILQFDGIRSQLVFMKKYGKLSQRLRKAVQFIPGNYRCDLAPMVLSMPNIDADGQQSIRRLNPKGQDVIKMKANGKLSGDLWWRYGMEYSGASRIVDIVYRGNGIYTVIDTTRGRVFTYDHEGNLLYIFGGKGSQKGTFKSPVAVEMKDDQILVLDSHRGEIMFFVATKYGSLINQDILRYDGDEASAVKI